MAEGGKLGDDVGINMLYIGTSFSLLPLHPELQPPGNTSLVHKRSFYYFSALVSSKKKVHMHISVVCDHSNATANLIQ